MSWEKRQQQNEERSAIVDELRQLTETAATEGRDLTEDETKRFDEQEARSKQLTASIARYDRLIDLAANEPAERRSHPGPGREDVAPNAGDITAEVPEKDLRNYSVLRVIDAQLEGRSIDGLEGELSQEIARRSQKDPQGVYVPHHIPLETRDLNTTAGAGAVGTVTTTTLIDMLRSRVLTTQLGATFLGGLTGNLSIPKQTGGATAYWVNESAAPTESTQAIGQVPLTPTTVGAYSNLSRRFIKQSSIDAEAFVRNDLVAVIARALDTAAYNGSGSGAEPEGILQNSSVSTVAIGTNGGAPTFAKMVELETEVAADDADFGSLHYVTTARARGAMKTTVKESGQATYIWSEQNVVNGYPAHATNLLPSDLTKGSGSALSAAIFGNWNDLIFGMWGGLDIMVDPYTNSTSGTVRVSALQDVDIVLRRDESFAKIVDIVTA